jgi:hypothetical protein
VWHHLLERPPRELVWSKDSPRPQWDEKRQQLSVTTEDLGLLRLGTTTDAGCKIELGISQPRWNGGVGLFLGYHAERVGDRSCFRYQLIALQPYIVGRPKGTPFTVQRSRQTLCPVPGKGYLTSGEVVAAQPVRSPPAHEQLLEIEVGRQGRLLRVRWAGEELPGLVTSQANGNFTPADYVGDFGTCNLDSASVFGTARFMLLEKEGP